MIICEYSAIMIFESNGGVSKKLIWTFKESSRLPLYILCRGSGGQFRNNQSTNKTLLFNTCHCPSSPKKNKKNIVTSQFAGVNPTETYYISTLSTKGNLDHIGMKITNIDHHLIHRYIYIYINTPGTPKNNL